MNNPTSTTLLVSLKKFALAASLMSAAQLSAANNPGTLDDRSDGGNYVDQTGSWGLYTVPANSTTGGSSLDPRVERRFDDNKIDTQYSRTFEARYNIVNADNTTIAQVLNYDASNSDTTQPQVFVVANSNGSKWDITNKGTFLFSINKNTSTSQPTFVLRIRSYSRTVNGQLGMYSDIFVNGSSKGTFKHARIGDQSTMRYGAYHHGSGTAKIRVSEVSFP